MFDILHARDPVQCETTEFRNLFDLLLYDLYIVVRDTVKAKSAASEAQEGVKEVKVLTQFVSSL